MIIVGAADRRARAAVAAGVQPEQAMRSLLPPRLSCQTVRRGRLAKPCARPERKPGALRTHHRRQERVLVFHPSMTWCGPGKYKGQSAFSQCFREKSGTFRRKRPFAESTDRGYMCTDLGGLEAPLVPRAAASALLSRGNQGQVQQKWRSGAARCARWTKHQAAWCLTWWPYLCRASHHQASAK
jgi:hypothetical protein